LSYKVKLDIFEGPLDLLLFLIKKEEMDIYDIPISKITEQFLEYINMMKLLNLDIAGEFLVMASTLMHIKSKMLLPKEEQGIDEEEEDPRAELAARLLEYQKFKEAAGELESLGEKQNEIFTRPFTPPKDDELFLEVGLFELMSVFSDILKKAKPDITEIMEDEVSVTDKMKEITELLQNKEIINFFDLFKTGDTRTVIIATFLALLELVRLRKTRILQSKAFGEIRIYRRDTKEHE
jgi:segregation and condensation protein A